MIKQFSHVLSRWLLIVSIPLLIVLIPMLFHGCAVYSPSISTPVLISEKHEKQIDAGITTAFPYSYSFVPSGFYGSFAYCIFDNTPVQFSASRMLMGHSRYELSAGYNLPITGSIRLGVFPGMSSGDVFSWEVTGYSMGIPDYDRRLGEYLAPNTRVQLLFQNHRISVGMGAKGSLYIPAISLNTTRLNLGNAFIFEPSIFITPTDPNTPAGFTVFCTYSKPFPMAGGSPDFSGTYGLEYPDFTIGIGFHYRFTKLR